jgi:hypothetical protein
MSCPPAERARAALLEALEPYAAPFVLVAATSTDWASGLFYGARHRLAIKLVGEGRRAHAEMLQRELSKSEIDLRLGFVGDIAVVARIDGANPILAIEALTIDDVEAVSGAVRQVG